MSGEPLRNCVVCFEELRLEELAHSPCKHCHVEFCTECLTRAFNIAEKDDVCEVFCPNPHCKKQLNADCMEIKRENIRTWVDTELATRKYGALNNYNGWKPEDLVSFIMNLRDRDINHLRRKSSAWQEQIIKLKDRAKQNDFSSIPMTPSLLTNHSQDTIVLRSKFRGKRSQSVGSAFDSLKRSQSAHSTIADRYGNNTPLVYGNNIEDEDSDDFHTDDDYSDADGEGLPRAGSSGQIHDHSKRPLGGLHAIIDEDEELQSYEYQSPISSLGNGDDFDFKTNENTQSVPTPNHKKRLSFKSLFQLGNGKNHQSVPVAEGSKVQQKRRRGLGKSESVRMVRDRAYTEDVKSDNKYKTKDTDSHKRSSHKIYNPFKKYRNAKKNKHKKQLKKTMSTRGLPSHTKQSKTLELRSKTPDPNYRYERDRGRSKSHNDKHHKMRKETNANSPPPNNANTLNVLERQRRLLNEQNKNKMRRNDTPRTKISNFEGEEEMLKPTKKLTINDCKALSAPVQQRKVTDLKVRIQGPKVIQLKPPSTQNTPSTSREHTPISELSKSRDITTPTGSDKELQPHYISTPKSSIPSRIVSLRLAPINSTKEFNDIEDINGDYPNTTKIKINVTSTISQPPTPMNDFEIEPHMSDNDESNKSEHKKEIDTTDHKSDIDRSYSMRSDETEEDGLVMVNDTFSIDDEDLPQIPTNIMHTHTNTASTLHMPVPTEIYMIDPDLPQPLLDMDSEAIDLDLPPMNPINVPPNIQTDGTLITKNGTHSGNDKNEPSTPDTPPTPESPHSGSMQSVSVRHFERVMKNIDNSLANHKQQFGEQINATSETPASEQNETNTNTYTKYMKPPPSPAPPEMDGCNGCHACVVL